MEPGAAHAAPDAAGGIEDWEEEGSEEEEEEGAVPRESDPSVSSDDLAQEQRQGRGQRGAAADSDDDEVQLEDFERRELLRVGGCGGARLVGGVPCRQLGQTGCRQLVGTGVCRCDRGWRSRHGVYSWLTAAGWCCDAAGRLDFWLHCPCLCPAAWMCVQQHMQQQAELGQYTGTGRAADWPAVETAAGLRGRRSRHQQHR